MLQLPGITADEIKKYRKQLKDNQIPDGKIDTFCRLSVAQRAKLNLFGGDKAKLAELEKVIKVMPLITCSNVIAVEGETTITSTDIISFNISLTYDNLPENQSPGYIHSENYPFVRHSNWYIVIVDAATKTNVIQIERLKHTEGSNICKFEMKQRFGRAGKFAFHCYISNDCYMGFDKEMAIEVEVVQDDPLRTIIEYSKEDVDAVKGPGLVQAMMQGEEEEEDDDGDDSSDDNPELLFKKLEDAGLKTPEAKKYAEAKAKAEKKKAEAGQGTTS